MQNEIINWLKRTLGITERIEKTLTSSVSKGIDSGFNKIRKSIETIIFQVIITIIVGFFLVWGLAITLDTLPSNGLGYVLIGAFLFVLYFFIKKG